MGVSSVCVEEGERRSEEEVGRSVGRSSVIGRSAGAAPKVEPHTMMWGITSVRLLPQTFMA